jgi:hypothetical protein
VTLHIMDVTQQSQTLHNQCAIQFSPPRAPPSSAETDSTSFDELGKHSPYSSFLFFLFPFPLFCFHSSCCIWRD